MIDSADMPNPEKIIGTMNKTSLNMCIVDWVKWKIAVVLVTRLTLNFQLNFAEANIFLRLVLLYECFWLIEECVKI